MKVVINPVEILCGGEPIEEEKAGERLISIFLSLFSATLIAHFFVAYIGAASK